MFEVLSRLTSNASKMIFFQNFRSVVHVPCTLECLVTCLVFNLTTFLPNAFLRLVEYCSISSGVIFLTHMTRWFLFSAKILRPKVIRHFSIGMQLPTMQQFVSIQMKSSNTTKLPFHLGKGKNRDKYLYLSRGMSKNLTEEALQVWMLTTNQLSDYFQLRVTCFECWQMRLHERPATSQNSYFHKELLNTI